MNSEIKNKITLMLPLILYGFLYMFIFVVLEGIEYEHYFDPSIALDSRIPFVPAFIVPYIMWFAWVPLVCIYLVIEDEEEFLKARFMLITGMTVFLFISAVFPTRLSLRPEVMPDDSIFCALIDTLYSADTSTNVFPSIHVYNTCVMWYTFIHSKGRLSESKAAETVMTLISILICMSTILIKQHSLIDVLGAFAMFFIVKWVMDRLYERKSVRYEDD